MENCSNASRGDDAVVMEKERSFLAAEGISKIYRLAGRNSVTALKNVSLAVPRGQCTVVTGPSGSGKSTLLNLLGCLDRPSGGRIYHNGEDVTGYSGEELCRIRREKVGFVFQGFPLLSRMTAWENVSVCLVPLGVREQDRFRRATVLLDRLNLHERIFHHPEELSGGEQQRVSVARALINGPELLLADEPTSNIDADSARMVLGLFSELKAGGCTIVITTHDLGLIRQDQLDEGGLKIDIVYRLIEGRIESSDLFSAQKT
jgi:ABC-type lipoprotein export system ATPase subunit